MGVSLERLSIDFDCLDPRVQRFGLGPNGPDTASRSTWGLPASEVLQGNPKPNNGKKIEHFVPLFANVDDFENDEFKESAAQCKCTDPYDANSLVPNLVVLVEVIHVKVPADNGKE